MVDNIICTSSADLTILIARKENRLEEGIEVWD